MAYELYQTLEIVPGASAEEVKRSYYRLVRKYSPEKAPERFKLIREAYDTLYDPKARQDYDALQQYGEEISRLTSEAEEKMSNEEWGAAVSIWKRILILRPNANGARQMLGVCYVREQNWDNALKVCQRLVRDNPDEPSYYLHYGLIFQQYADSLDEDNQDKHQLFEQAREQFKKSIDLEPYNSQPYLEISRTHAEEREYDQALQWAERAIGADGKTDFYDFDTLFYICIIHFRNNQLDNIDQVSQRIIALLPEDNEDIHKFVASKFADMGFDLGKYGYENQNVEVLRAASSFLSTARRFDPNNEEILNTQNQVDGITRAHDLLDLLNADSQISEGFYTLALFCLAVHFNHEIEDKDSVLENILNIIFNSPPQAVLTSNQRIKSQYRPIYALNEKLFDFIENTAQERLNPSNLPEKTPATTTPTKGGFNGCAFFFGVAVIIIALISGLYWFIGMGIMILFGSFGS